MKFPADPNLVKFAANRPVTLFVLVLFGALFFIPGIGTVHLFDWDEANFAEASREMMESGNYSQVTINYQPFYEKPPLFFWLQTLSMRAFGVSEFGARLVDALTGIATLVIVYLIGSSILTPLFGFLWALAFFGSFMPHLFFKSGIIDPVFNLLIFIGLWLIIKALRAEPDNRRVFLLALSGLFIGLATLAKGPVAFLILCLTMLIYWITVRFRPILRRAEIVAFLLTFTGACSVFFGIETFSHGPAFILNFIAYQVRLFTTGDAGQGRPFYFHFLVILFGCFPASFFAILPFLRRHGPGRLQNEKFNLTTRFMFILFWVRARPFLYCQNQDRALLFARLVSGDLSCRPEPADHNPERSPARKTASVLPPLLRAARELRHHDIPDSRHEQQMDRSAHPGQVCRCLPGQSGSLDRLRIPARDRLRPCGDCFDVFICKEPPGRCGPRAFRIERPLRAPLLRDLYR